MPERLVGEGLQNAHRADQFGGISRSIGKRILRKPRTSPHRPAESVKRQHDDRDRRQHEEGKPRTTDDHHHARADKQHDVAQRDRNRAADRGFDLRRIGGEPRDHLAGSCFVEESGRQRGYMGEHVAAQIGDDALAKRGDEVVAERARQRQHPADADHDQEIIVDQRQAARGKAEIDHPPHRDRHDERSQRCENQGSERSDNPPAVAFDVRQQRSQRAQIGPARRSCFLRRACDQRRLNRRDHRCKRCSGGKRRRILSGIKIHTPQHLFAAHVAAFLGQCARSNEQATCGKMAGLTCLIDAVAL